MKQRIIIFSFLFLISFFGISQNIKDSVRISLVAIRVKNLDSTINWYTQNLNFSLVEKKEFQGLRIAFLKISNLELELVESGKTLLKSDVIKETDSNNITGFDKISLSIPNIEQIYSRLKKQNIRFVSDLKKSSRKENMFYFIIEDNERNWIQLTGERNESTNKQ